MYFSDFSYILPKYIQSIQNEYICMKAAKKIGLNVANVEIRKIDDLEFLLVERFDRYKGYGLSVGHTCPTINFVLISIYELSQSFCS